MAESYNLLGSTGSNQTDSSVDLTVPVAQKSEPVTVKQLANKDEFLLDNIVEQTTQPSLPESQILQDLEQMDPALMLDAPVLTTTVAQKKFAKLFFVFTAFLAVLSLTYYLNLTQRFLGFTSLDFVSQSQQKLTSVQTDQVKRNYILSSLAVENIALEASKLNQAYVQSNNASISQSKQNLKTLFDVLGSNLKAADTALKSNQNISSELLVDLNNETAKYLSLAEKEGIPEKQSSYKTLHRIYTGAARISVNNEEYLSLVTSDLDSLSNSQVIALLTQLLAVSDYSPVTRSALVELNRKNWTAIFNELESVTKQFDPAFNIFQNQSNYTVAFSNYSFNADENIINVTGEVKTRDSKTFTLITNLIDALDKSPLFENLNYSTFTKSFDEDSLFYNSTLNLSFSLENNLIYD